MARFEPNTLFHNRGDRFADITAAAGVGNPGKGHGVGFADYDLDGDLDLYTAVGGHYPGDLWPNSLYRNEGHHYNLGLFFVRHGYFPQAENKFDRAIALRPGDLALLNRLAGDLLKLQQPEAALRYLQIALDQDPEYFPALLNAGHIAGQLRRYDDAVAYCRRAVAVRPDDAEGWYLLGLGLFSNGERAAAEQALRRSLALSADAEALRAKTQQLLNTLQQQPTGTP